MKNKLISRITILFVFISIIVLNVTQFALSKDLDINFKNLLLSSNAQEETTGVEQKCYEVERLGVLTYLACEIEVNNRTYKCKWVEDVWDAQEKGKCTPSTSSN